MPQNLGQGLSVAAVKRNIQQILEAANIEDAALEARLIIEEGLGISRAEIILKADENVPRDDLRKAMNIVMRRQKGEPLDHIFGFQEFYGLKFNVDEHVLTPRPETELLIDYILSKTDNTSKASILDLGTGSGAIPISILTHRPMMMATASDVSQFALNRAHKNAADHAVHDRINFVQSHWWDNISGNYDFVISNPPYIASDVIKSLSNEVRHFDPILALDGGRSGLTAYREIVKQTHKYLRRNGELVLEIGFDQGEALKSLLSDHRFTDIVIHQDLSSNDRMVTAQCATD